MKKRIMSLLVFASITAFSTTQAEASSKHTVENGDTMYKIANSNGMSLEKLVQLNPQISNPNLIYIGQHINLDGDGQPQRAQAPVEVREPTKPVVQEQSGVNASDKDLLARLIQAEAKGESYQGKVAVAKVVLNRTVNDEFPNSIRGVIYQSGQFSPVSNGMINKPAGAESVRAAEEALRIGANPSGAMYFYNPATADTSWIGNRPVVSQIGNHVFAK